jgi:cephalosporin hydroxylase
MMNTPPTRDVRERNAATHQVAIFGRPDWQTPLGDRAALGVLTRIKPSLSIEIGTAQGGSLDRIAAHSQEVHALDLNDELLALAVARVNLRFGGRLSSKHASGG